jgi:hypothetical protein
MKTRAWKIEDGRAGSPLPAAAAARQRRARSDAPYLGEGWNARSVLECGGKRSATPLSEATGTEAKLRRRCALPEHSKAWRLALLLGFLILHSTFCLWALGQSYSIDWYKISGGGGTSTGATYQVTGTIGQPEAGSTMSGGQYSLTGGFWSLIAVVQTAGAPRLTIAHSGNSVTVSWPVTAAGIVLKQNNSVANAAGWSTYGGTINTANGTNSITVTSPTGNQYYGLFHQ